MTSTSALCRALQSYICLQNHILAYADQVPASTVKHDNTIYITAILQPSRACSLVSSSLQVLYQGEALVDLLVSAHAHHYLEFKLVDGRCVPRVSHRFPAQAWMYVLDIRYCHQALCGKVHELESMSTFCCVLQGFVTCMYMLVKCHRALSSMVFSLGCCPYPQVPTKRACHIPFM